MKIIQRLVKSVNNNMTGIFERNSEKIVTLPDTIASIIGNKEIYISEFIIAKIKGKIKNLPSHPEISDKILLKIPISLSSPKEILEDTRATKKFIFISIDPLHEIVVEICRKNSGKSEINTVHLIDPQELKRLENKFPIVYSSGETPNSRICASPD